MWGARARACVATARLKGEVVCWDLAHVPGGWLLVVLIWD